jgi:hypothetical protein
VVPPVSDLDGIRTTLKQDGVLRDQGWTKFLGELKGDEAEVYNNRMTDTVTSIIKTTSPTPRIEVFCGGTHAWRSERPDSHKPDGGMKFRVEHRKSLQAKGGNSSEDRPCVEDVFTCLQFKKGPTSVSTILPSLYRR